MSVELSRSRPAGFQSRIRGPNSRKIVMRRGADVAFQALALLVLILALASLATLIWDIVSDGAGTLSWDFITGFSSRRASQAGIWHALTGSIFVIAVTGAIAVPIGVAAAIYLEEYGGRSLAARIIEQLEGPFDPTQFDDRYEDALKALIAEKQKGHKVEKAPEQEDTNVVDLMDALRRSLGQAPAPEFDVLQVVAERPPGRLFILHDERRDRDAGAHSRSSSGPPAGSVRVTLRPPSAGDSVSNRAFPP